MFDILELPPEDLKRILTKASARSLARLVAAYPRSAGRTFLTVLSGTFSRTTLEFLIEEMNAPRNVSLPLIRQAESELLKIIDHEHRTMPLIGLTPAGMQPASHP